MHSSLAQLDVSAPERAAVVNGTTSRFNVRFASVKTPGMPMVGLILACISLCAALYGASFFLAQSFRRRFTVTLVLLMLVNFLAAVLQVAEAGNLYVDNTITPIRVWRNWLYAITTMLSNLVQLGILSIFENNLWHGRVFSTSNMWIVYTAAVALHLLCALPTYAEGILFVNDGTKLIDKYSIYAMGGYAFFVALWGIVQGLFVLNQVQRHLINVSSNHTGGSFRKGNARTIRALILFTLAVDLLALAAFIVSNLIGTTGAVERVELSYSLEQIAFALASIHLASETLLFQATVQQFRKSSKPSSQSRSGLSSPLSPGGYSSTGSFGGAGHHSNHGNYGYPASPTQGQAAHGQLGPPPPKAAYAYPPPSRDPRLAPEPGKAPAGKF
ncbi:hypothetical protein HK105_200401 [Polyrhizophydium stewartii]|uniref:Uncharacterized protein n=1 Tax=Polyrhizophydium stewartii TaxID=2732419 RepID=A0ABR4NLB6_9FUNG|nr:hypothetical protein HK105_008152 [Polyrhizophydium stewartii]